MGKRGIIFGMVLAGLVVTGFVGAATAVDKLNGPGTPDVTVERINDTHAAVSWTTDEPTNGTLTTFTQHRNSGSWIAVNTINDSSFSRSHLVIAPIYELNTTQMNQTRANLPTDSYSKQYMQAPPTRYKVTVGVYGDGSGASEEIVQHAVN